jgi:hypothetical protein
MGGGRGTCRRSFSVIVLVLSLAGSGLARQESAPADPGKVPTPPGEPPEAAIETGRPSVLLAPQFRARVGFCLLPGFDADLQAGKRSFSSRGLPTFSAEATVPVGLLFLSAAAEFAPSEQIDMTSVFLSAGLATSIGERWEAAWDVEVAVGAFLSDLNVDESRFGDFDAAAGGFARVDLGADLGQGWRASLWAGVRWAEYNFEPEVVSGDRSAGGIMPMAGLSLSLSF